MEVKAAQFSTPLCKMEGKEALSLSSVPLYVTVTVAAEGQKQKGEEIEEERLHPLARDLKRRHVRMQQYYAYQELLGEDVVSSALPDPGAYPTKRVWENAMRVARVELRKLAFAQGMVAPGLFEQTWQ